MYTDGACLGNPGPGGWAWAVPGARYASGASPATTNQRMEIRAALEAVTTLDGPLEVVSDSTYVVNCFRDR
ncbi:MAG TPA: RNase H family protein, partial [Acidimicrobiales bacterium]